MEIRLANKADAEKIEKYFLEMWLMHWKNEPQFLSKKEIDKSDVKGYLKNCFNNSHKSYLLVAEENGVIIGLLKMNIEKIEKFFLETRVLYLDDIFVLKEYRGRGVAKKLFQEAEKIAKKRKIKWLKGRIYEFNLPAQKMAKAIGLKPLYREYFKVL